MHCHHGFEQRFRIAVGLGRPHEGGAGETLYFLPLNAFEFAAHHDRSAIADGGIFEHDDIPAGDTDHRAGRDRFGGHIGDGVSALADIEDEVLGDIVRRVEQPAVRPDFIDEVLHTGVQGDLGSAADGFIQAVINISLADNDRRSYRRHSGLGAARLGPRT